MHPLRPATLGLDIDLVEQQHVVVMPSLVSTLFRSPLGLVYMSGLGFFMHSEHLAVE